MGDGQRYETEWDGLRIVIEERPKHFQVFIYDPGKCEVLYIAEQAQMTAFRAPAQDAPHHHARTKHHA
jgi:hypothetical protein